MTSLDQNSAFLHVIDSHRWLAASGCAWNSLHARDSSVRAQADSILPNIDVMVRDCLLLHARSLIKFYRNVGRDDDIFLKDFGVTLDKSLDVRLREYEHPIEVHLFHLTDWRDFDYRTSHPTGPGATRDRPDWNHDVTIIVSVVFEALKCVSENGLWKEPFHALYDACVSRYQDKSSAWPKNLGDKADVERYLGSLPL